MRFISFCTLGAFLLPAGLLAAAEPAAGKVDFNRDIRPIFSDICFACHGPDKNQRKADLRLDVKDDVYKQRDGYALVVPGKPADSELFARITETDSNAVMPPPKSEKKLTAKQIDLIKRWIEQGAEWKGHWAYIPPARPAVPQIADDRGFIRNDVDRFVLAKLRESGLSPAPEADRVTLIRRLSFDLLGLPPSPKEVADFVNDQSADAYEKLVDRLLSSPHFGERMALVWLDLVRYADTNGYHGDNHEDRDMYRDWVINAFNDNMPFDKFTVEQLAGDLLPNRTTDQLIASGYNRLLMTTREGGSQAKEYMAKYSADRVRNFSAVWLAGTMGCCECHDHKYDPFSTRDFYSLAAFFADIQEIAVGEQPGTKMPTPEEGARLQQFDEQIAPLRKILDTQTPELDAAQIAWEESLRNRKVEWTVLKPAEFTSKSGAELKYLEDGSIVASGPSPKTDTYDIKLTAPLKGVTALRLEALAADKLPAKGPGRASNGNFVLNEFTVKANDEPIAWSSVTATHSQNDFPIVNATDGKPKTGWAIANEMGRDHVAVFETKTDLGDGSDVTLNISLPQNHGERHTLGRFRISATSSSRPIRADSEAGLPKNLSEILALEPEKRSDKQKHEIAAHFRTVAPLLEPTRQELGRVQKERDALYKSVRTTLVSMSGSPRTMRILPRGNWLDETGETVNPAPPSFLSPALTAPESGRLSRLDLARWLITPDHPLTSRVFVNRLWKIAFGQGLVRSTEDFGAQGTPPTHPDLFDWLALEFTSPSAAKAQSAISNLKSEIANSSPWDTKRLLKLLVMSGTYRQSSATPRELRERDPFNLLLARQARFRLDAEMVRDNSLAVSGLLVNKLGGPSARPYQPPLYWSYLNFPKREYQADLGDGLYRRGLYTYWCRTFLHPSMKAFDAPTREECTADRPRSNNPLQALVLLNDPSYVEAARAFAEKILRDGGTDTASRLEFAYLQSLSRRPRPEELSVLTELHQRHLKHYASEQESAASFLRVGERPAPKDVSSAELAAWTSVARVILNLNEMITRN